MDKCQVCGGVVTCPRNWYLEMREMPGEAVRYILEHEAAPGGWLVTHTKKGRRIACKLEPIPVFELELVSTMQSRRIHAHYGAYGRLVGAVIYAFAVRRAQRAGVEVGSNGH